MHGSRVRSLRASVFCFLAVLVRRELDAQHAALAIALYGTTLMVLQHHARAALDVPLTACCIAVLERSMAWLRRGGIGPALGCGVALGAGLLVKGPLVMLFCVPAVIAAWMWGGRRHARTPWTIAIAPLLGFALFAAWLVPALDLGGDAFRDRFFGQVGSRGSGAEGQHVKGAHFYPWAAALFWLPWSFHHAMGIVSTARGDVRGPDRALARACLAGLLVGFVALSLVATKRETYLMPLVPFAAICAAIATRDAGRRFTSVHGTRIAIATPWIAAGALAALPFLGDRVFTRAGTWWGHGLDLARLQAVSAALVFAVGTGVLVWRARTRHPQAVLRCALGLACISAAFQIGVFSSIDAKKSFVPLGDAARVVASGAPIHSVGTMYRGNLLWGSGRDRVTHHVDAASVLAAFEADQPPGVLVADATWWHAHRAMDAQPFRTWSVRWEGMGDHRSYVVVTPPDDTR